MESKRAGEKERGLTPFLLFLAVVLFFVFSLELTVGTGGYSKLDFSFLLQSGGTQEPEKALRLMESAPVLAEDIGEAIPSVFVDQEGYQPESDKLAVLIGEELPDEVFVVNRETGEEVLRVATEKREGVAIADFTALSEEGEYILRAAILGESYPFAVREGLYREVAKRLTGVFSLAPGATVGWQETGTESLASRALAVKMLLLSYEMNEEIWAGDDADGNGVPDIIDLTTLETARILGITEEALSAKKATEETQTLTVEEKLLCAAALADYAYQYRQFDERVANGSLQAADAAFQRAMKENGAQEADETLVFFSAAELYRASGSARYTRYLNDYFANVYAQEADRGVYEFLGEYAYIFARQKVDVAVCTSITKKLMQHAEEISAAIPKHFIMQDASAAARQAGEAPETEAMLSDVVRLAAADTLIPNHEYDTLIENRLHTLLGVNERAESRIEGAGFRACAPSEAVNRSFLQSAACVFLCSVVAN